jgi:hypothetical protein
MKITIGQFIGLLALAVLVYYVVSPWWSDQDRGHWINRFNKSIIDDDREEASSSKTSAEPYDPSGWS